MKRFLLSSAVVFLASHTLASAEDSATETLGVMYWTDRTVGIYRAARGGSEIQLIVPRTFTNSIAVDREGDRLYWTTVANRARQQVQLWQGKLDGSQRQQVAGGLAQPDGLALDVDNRKLYWVEQKISQANLDGTSIEVLVSGKSELYSSLEILPPKE